MGITLLINHKMLVNKWSGKWVYLGKNYLDIKQNKNKLISKNRISLTKYFRAQLNIERLILLSGLINKENTIMILFIGGYLT